VARRTATRPVAGNAMIRRARRSATRSALARNARCSASRRNVPNAQSTANNPNVLSAVLKTCVKRTAARSVRQCAPRHSVTPLVWLPKQTVRRYVKRRRAVGRAPNPPPVRDPNASSNVRSPHAMSKTNRNAVNVPRRMCASLRNTPETSPVRLIWNRRSWKWLRTSNTPLRMELKSAVRAPKNKSHKRRIIHSFNNSFILADLLLTNVYSGRRMKKSVGRTQSEYKRSIAGRPPNRVSLRLRIGTPTHLLSPNLNLCL